MSIPLWLRERFGPRVQIQEGSSRVQFGSPARYELHAERPIVKSISAIKALARRHVPLIVAKRQIEELMLGCDVSIDVPMLEDAAIFEAELQELGIRAVKTASAAAAES
jgi:hypothetical protein